MASSSTITRWNDIDFLNAVERTTAANMELACIKVADDVRTSFGAAGPEPTKRGGGFKKRISKEWRHSNRSNPDEPPHVDTGRLRASISWLVSDGRRSGSSNLGDATGKSGSVTGLVGTDVKYGRALELGYAPRNLAARPYLRPALERNLDFVRRLFQMAFSGRNF